MLMSIVQMIDHRCAGWLFTKGRTFMKNGDLLLRGCRPAFIAAFATLLVLPLASYAADQRIGEGDAMESGALMPATSILGNSPQQIHANFASIIESNFRTGNAEEIIRNLSAQELSDLATRYQAESPQGVGPLLAIMAARLSDQGLMKIGQTFGRDNVQNAVNTYSSPEMKAAVTPELAALPATNMVKPMATPTVDMTISEIYLEFRTAPVGSLSAQGALAETAMFAAGRLVPAAWVGNAIGTQINNAINTYDPALGDAIGGTVYGMVNQIQAAQGDVRQGQYLKAVDDLFGDPVWNSGNKAGDFDVSLSMRNYFQYLLVTDPRCTNPNSADCPYK
jgi:hypothetical protein